MKKQMLRMVCGFSMMMFSITVATAQEVWTKKSNIGGVARWAATGFSIGDFGYITCGQDNSNKDLIDLWQYDAVSDTWTQKADFPGTSRSSASGFSIGTKGYVCAGAHNGSILLNDFWEYNVLTNNWTRLADCPGPERYGGLGLSLNGLGYFGIGWAMTSYYDDFWEYDPATDVWTEKAKYPGKGRVECGGFTIRDSLYVGSGSYPCGTAVNDFWMFDPSANTWTAKATIPGTTKQNPVCFTLCDRWGFFGLGDNCGMPYVQNVNRYDPATDTWTAALSFPGPGRDNPVWFAIENRCYCGTGLNGSKLNDFWEYSVAGSCSTSGVNDHEDALDFISAFPNPASNGMFRINAKMLKKGEIFIYNEMGETVYNATVQELKNYTVNLSASQKGIYFVKIRNEDKYYYKKIILD